MKTRKTAINLASFTLVVSHCQEQHIGSNAFCFTPRCDTTILSRGKTRRVGSSSIDANVASKAFDERTAARYRYHNNLALFSGREGVETTSTTQTDSNPACRSTDFSTSSSATERKQVEKKVKAIDIALSYQPTQFDPLPFAANRHVQTVGGALLRGYGFREDGYDFSYWPPVKRSSSEGDEVVAADDEAGFSSWYDKRERVETECGDFFDVDYKFCRTRTMANGKEPRDTDSEGLVVIAHGLESSSFSPQIFDAATAYLNVGMDVACVNFRACSGEPNRTPGAYHLGFTDDLKYFLSKLEREGRGGLKRRVYLCGFSLGANVVLKLLGELGDSALEMYSIHGAAVGAAPFDLVASAPKMTSTAFNRAVYDANLLSSLKKKAQRQYETLGGEALPYDIEQCLAAETIAEFENAYLCPVYGFEDNWDYYRKNSCIGFMDGIAVPTMVVNALDDPFFDPECYPEEDASRPLRLHYTPAGGHLGYMFQQRKGESRPKSSWFSTELAAFINHVHRFDEIDGRES